MPVRIVGGEAQLWSVMTGQSILTPLAHPKPVWALAFDPSGHLLLTGCEDRRARFFVAATGTLLDRLLAPRERRHRRRLQPRWAKGLTASAAASRAAARLWDVCTGIDSARSGPSRAHRGPDLQPRPAAPPDSQPRRDCPPLGHPFRRARGEPMRHRGPVRRRPSAPTSRRPHRELGSDSSALGRGDGPSPGPTDDARGPVVALAFSPDSRIVLTGTLGGGPGTGGPGCGTWRPPDHSVRH